MTFCFRPEDDEKLARGWPNLIVPIDGHPHDKRAEKSAEKAWRVCDPIYFTEWPRATLHRFMRAAIATLFVNYRPSDYAAITKALATDGAPSANESLDALGRLFHEGYDTYRFKEAAFAFAVETIAGTDATLDAIMKAIESAKWPATASLNHLCRAALVSVSAFLLLRASPAAAKRARATLEKELKDTAAKPGEYAAALDYAANGAEGIKRTATKWVYLESRAILGVVGSLDFAGDDPDYVRAMIPKAKATNPMSVRVAYIAGPSALANLSARKWPAIEMPSVVRDFGMIRDPEIVTFMLSLVGKSSVKDAPLAWFRAHADYAKPILEKSKQSSAKAILKQLA